MSLNVSADAYRFWDGKDNGFEISSKKLFRFFIENQEKGPFFLFVGSFFNFYHDFIDNLTFEHVHTPAYQPLWLMPVAGTF